MAVDTHIFRVSNRTDIAPGEDVREVEEQLIKVVPQEFQHDAHHWLILHGRYMCVARKPKCPECLIMDLCEYRREDRAPEKPRSAKKSSSRSGRRSIESRHAFFPQPIARSAAPRVHRGLAQAS